MKEMTRRSALWAGFGSLAASGLASASNDALDPTRSGPGRVAKSPVILRLSNIVIWSEGSYRRARQAEETFKLSLNFANDFERRGFPAGSLEKKLVIDGFAISLFLIPDSKEAGFHFFAGPKDQVWNRGPQGLLLKPGQHQRAFIDPSMVQVSRVLPGKGTNQEPAKKEKVENLSACFDLHWSA